MSLQQVPCDPQVQVILWRPLSTNRQFCFEFLNSFVQTYRLRFANHLLKCQKSYKGTDMRKCMFNETHHIPAPELDYHQKHCSDRLYVEKAVEARSAKRKSEADDEPAEAQIEKKQRAERSTDDEWDDEDEVSLSAKFNFRLMPFHVRDSRKPRRSTGERNMRSQPSTSFTSITRQNLSGTLLARSITRKPWWRRNWRMRRAIEGLKLCNFERI